MASSSSANTIRTWIYRLLLSTAIAVSVMIFVQDILFEFDFFDRFSLSFIDRSFAKRGPLNYSKDSLDVIIISISDKSETTLPERFPFPRSYYARAVHNLNRAGAKAIGIDLTFEQPDARGANHDEELFKSIQQYRNVVVAGKTDMKNDEVTVQRAEENFHSIFYSADSSVGSVFVPNDIDGVYRRYMPFAKMPGQERYIASFSFAVLNKVLGLPSTAYAENTPDAFVIGDHRVPKYDDVSMLINYHGPAGKTFKEFDIVNILDDKDFQTVEEKEFRTSINVFDDPDYGLLHDGTFKDKIVLIGPYFSESKDLFNVSVSEEGMSERNQMYGVELHANALQTLLHQNYLRRISVPSESFLILIFSLLTFAIVSSLKSIRTQYAFIVEIAAVIIVAGLIDGVLILSYYTFAEHNLVFPVVTLIAAVILNYVGSAVYQYLTERKQKTMIKGMFSQYLNPSVVNELIAHPEKLRLGGEKKELSVFFSDIASFTNFSEKLDAVELVQLLNEYLSSMTDIILKNDGTLDKYVGDAVMAVWGAPMELRNSALNACRAALQMQAAVRAIDAKWKDEGKPELIVRMGINTDYMVVGNVGGSKRFDYTVIGDAVNLGSRMEGANKTYNTRIMISERTQEMVKDEMICRELDLLVVKGKTKPIRVFELIAEKKDFKDEKKLQVIDVYSKGLELYRQRKFKEALQTFYDALQIDEDDGPSQLYFIRTDKYIKSPPPDDWNGVFELKTK
ncbi:MAG: CHASE2 domain-containing protein [Ignavibacteriales bacterium]|nr:CHASE2 domain-containing protein [Ignavibacteriales bacterium]